MEPAPSAGRRRSRAAGLRCGGPDLHSSSGSGPPSTRPRACLAAGEGARARVSLLPAPLPPGRLRDRAGFQSRERAEQRAAAPASLPARGGGAEPAVLSLPVARASRLPSLPARPPLSAPRRACSQFPGTPLASPLARSLPAPALSAPSSASSHPLPRRDPPRLTGAGTSQSEAGLGGGPRGWRSSTPTPTSPHPRASGVAFPCSSRLPALWGGSAEGCLCGSGLPS